MKKLTKVILLIGLTGCANPVTTEIDETLAMKLDKDQLFCLDTANKQTALTRTYSTLRTDKDLMALERQFRRIYRKCLRNYAYVKRGLS